MQTLYHGLLLFVLPAYWASATLDSPNVVFLACVVAGALVTAVDPWYAAARPPAALAQPGAAGLFHLRRAQRGAAAPPRPAHPGSRGRGGAHGGGDDAGVPRARRADVAAGLREVRRARRCSPWRPSGSGARSCRPRRSSSPGRTAARSVTMLEPVEPIDSPIPARTVADWGGLAAYTAVYAPGGAPAAHRARVVEGRPAPRARAALAGAGRAQGRVSDLLAQDRSQAAVRRVATTWTW